MKKEQFIQKVASGSPSLLQKRDIVDKVVDEYYRNNPHKEIDAHKRSLLEVGLPTLLGSAMMRGRNPRMGAGLGLIGGIGINQLAHAGRRQRAAKNMGVDTDLLNLKVHPLTPEAKDKYFK